MENILLKDVLNFDGLRKRYPKKRIKLRFNTSWTDESPGGEKMRRDYLKLYKSTDEEDIQYFWDNIMSSKSAKAPRILDNDIVFQFIEIRDHIWLLIDAVNINKAIGDRKGYNSFGCYEFDVAEGERLTEYNAFFHRLTVNWMNKPRQFFYVDEDIVDSVPVAEILPSSYLTLDEEFCGYEGLSRTYNELKFVIDKPSWKSALSNVYGVYVLTDASNGKLYIGSATGELGVYGRWSTYLESGYDKVEINGKEYPNKRLKEIVDTKGIEHIQKYFIYSVLEIFPKNEMGAEKALQREAYWKNMLLTRTFGYNDN